MDLGHDVNAPNEDGKTGLMTATLHEQLHVVSYLIQQRATDVSIIGGVMMAGMFTLCSTL